MKRLFIVALFAICELSSFGQARKLIRQAENQIDRGNLREAIERYQKALAADPENRSANLELGLVYSELLDNYEKAEPYLEKAYRGAESDSLYDVIFALAKCYHFRGDFDKALSFFDRLDGVQDLEKETDFQKELQKRKKDCEYAKAQANKPADDNLYLVNCGKKVNSDMPEYVPVITSGNELLFTSKRKDDKDEELNYLDGKYFESMYIARISASGFSDVRRYTLPDKLINSKFYKHHQAVVSLSQDGKKLFTFKDSKLYEISADQRDQSEPTEIKINQFNHYQNHAFLTGDGKTLYFTSDVPGGFGGTDIYRSERTAAGEWGPPKNLGEPINTAFDEDAPFISKDGTLYFASKGHEGFGNYDLYKSYLVDGKWSAPENLGAPINSTGHDIFMVFDSAAAIGYFSSCRKGGYGDMDIYRIVYLDKIKRDCYPGRLPVALRTQDEDTSDFSNMVRLDLPPNYSHLKSEWWVDNKEAAVNETALQRNYGDLKPHQVRVKALVGCDTCLMPLVACIEMKNQIHKTPPAVLAAKEKEKSSKTEVPDKQQGDNKSGQLADSGKDKSGAGHPVRTKGQDKNSNEERGRSLCVIYFGFNQSQLSADAKKELREKVLARGKGAAVISLHGYADARGSSAANIRVSERRAKATERFLLDAGISGREIKKVSGHGAARFVNRCAQGVQCEESEHQLNRRVEVIVVE